MVTTCHMGGDVLTEVPAWGDVGVETSWACRAFLFSLESVEGWLSSRPALDCLLPSLLLHEIAKPGRCDRDNWLQSPCLG